jgi:hypothetical protein
MAASGVASEISSVPQADKTRLSAMKRTKDRRIITFPSSGIKRPDTCMIC